MYSWNYGFRPLKLGLPISKIQEKAIFFGKDTKYFIHTVKIALYKRTAHLQK